MWNSSIIIHPHNTHSINIQSIWVISYLLIDVVIVNSHPLSLSLSLVCFDTSSLLLFTQHAKVSINYYLWTLVKCKCPTICLISFRSSIPLSHSIFLFCRRKSIRLLGVCYRSCMCTI